MRPRVLVLVVACACGAGVGMLLAWHQLHGPPGARSPRPDPSSAPAAAISAVRELTSLEELTRLANDHPDGVLLDFHAQWCVPCQELAPRLERLAALHPQLVVAAVDAAAYPKLADAYNVDVLPALVHLVHGREIARHVGAPSEAELTVWLGLASAPDRAPGSIPGGTGSR